MSERIIHVYATQRSRRALLMMPRETGRTWLRSRGFPAFWDRPRGGYIVMTTVVVDIVVMARWEGWHVIEHHASGPRQAELRRRHAIAAHEQRRSA